LEWSDLVGLRNWVRNWNSTPAERAAGYPCDGCRPAGSHAYFRATSVKASPALAYRWLCQLRVAPYSYDLLDNRGKRSPRELTPGLDQLSVGDEFLVFRTTEVVAGDHITGVASAEVERVYGPISGTYKIVALPDGTSRIVVKMWLGARGRLGGLKRALLVVGDAVMMRKQLLTLRDLAERDERRAAQRAGEAD
jgi:hypothetical protein